jgi:hypothetical protein
MVHKTYQERRCQIGLHNFPSQDDNPVLCERCKYMQLSYNPYDKNNEIIDTFKNINLGHKNGN